MGVTQDALQGIAVQNGTQFPVPADGEPMTTPASQQVTSSPTTNPPCQTVTSAAVVRPVDPANGAGTAGLVLGIVGAAFCWVPLLGFALGVLAVVFGGLGIAAASRGEATNRTAAAWGLALGIFALVFWPAFIIIAALAML